MSDLSDSGSSTLSDWALVNRQGELEGSDADSNTSSIEVVEREVEEEGGQHGLDSRESSPECIELEQLMKLADTAARDAGRAQRGEPDEPEKSQQGASFTPPVSSQHGLCETSAFHLHTHLEEGACSLLEVDTAEKRETARGSHVTQTSMVSNFSHDARSAASSDSVLSLSGVSSLSNISRSSRTDSDSESDFVRLEKGSSSISTESEGEEPHSMSRANVMATSASSIGSGFNFLCSTRAGAPLSAPPHLSLEDTPPPSPPPLPPLQLPAEGEVGPQAAPLLAHPRHEEEEVIPAEEQHVIPAAEDRLVAAVEDEINPAHGAEDQVIPPQEGEMVGAQEEAEEEEGGEEEAEAVEVREGMIPQDEGEEVDDDADTESSTEDGDQDDRIESEQSDDAHSAPPDDLDQVDLSVVNDIGDLPVGRGDVERHYIHYRNATLNGRLNTVVLAVLVLALGMGLGHWIGSTREHFSQLEIQLSQMKRLHQVQDDYMECLSRNDQLLVDTDTALQSERERHQEATSDLRDVTHDLQEQLQDAQDQLEQLLAATVPQASRQPRSPSVFAHDLQYALTLSKMLIVAEEQFQESLSDWDTESQRQLLQVREAFTQAMQEREGRQRSQAENKLQQEVDRERQFSLHLQDVHRQLNERVNHLETENADLKVSVGKMRYMADSQPQQPPASPHNPCPPSAGHKPLPSPVDEPLPPPPKPLPPPPFAGDGDGPIDMEQEEHQEGRMNGKGTYVNDAGDLKTVRSAAQGSGHVYLSDDMEQEAHRGEEKENVISDKEKEDVGGDSVDEDMQQTVAGREQDVHDDNEGTRDHSAARKACGSRESPQPIPVDMRLLQRNLTQERQRAAMWRHLYLWERQERHGMNATACLHYLSRTFNMSALLQMMEGWNLTGVGVGVEGLGELGSLMSSLAQLHQHLLHSLPALWQDLSTKIHHLHSDLASHYQQAGQQQGQGQAEKEGGGGERKDDGSGGGEDADEPEDTPRMRWSEGVKKLLNKTRGTLSNVSRHLQQTWHQVKDASRRFWPAKDSILSHMAAQVKDSMTRLSHKVQGKASFWFRKRSKWGKPGDGKATFPQDREGQDQGRERSKRKRDNSKEDRPDHQENDHPHKKKSDPEKGWNKHDKGGIDKHHHKHSPHRKRKDDSEQLEDSHHKRDDKSRKHDLKDSHDDDDDDENRQRNKLGPHPPDERNHKDQRESKKTEPDRHHHHQSHSKDGKKYNAHSKNHREDSHGKKDKKEKYHQEKSRDKDDDDDDDDDKRSNKSQADKVGQFSTKAKDHWSHWDKAAHKARYKVQKRFHKLFTKVGAMSKTSYNNMDRGDLREMFEDVEKVWGLYQDNKHLDLPESGHKWLQCQYTFWMKASPRRVRYNPQEECLQLLAPWQMGFVQELRARLQTRECLRVRYISCIDGGGFEPDPEDYYKYVCAEDDDFHRYNKDFGDVDDADDDIDNDDDEYERKKRKSQASPKGQREGEGDKTEHDSHGLWKAENGKESMSPTPSQQVNQSDDNLHTWYFNWVKGRNNMRSLEHKADWLFERASERGEAREQEHSADWLFERAAERHASREDEVDTAEHKEGDDHHKRHGDRMAEQEGHHGKRGHQGERGHDGERGHHRERGHHNSKKGRHRKGHGGKEGHHKRQGQGQGKHHKHKDKGHHFKRYKKDYRQKYGRTTF